MSTIAPERSLEQRMSALQTANDVRLWRAEQKRKLKAGEVLFVDVLWCEDERLETMRLRELLLAIPKMGAGKADRVLAKLRISSSRRLGAMTERQMTALVRELERTTPVVRRNALGY